MTIAKQVKKLSKEVVYCDKPAKIDVEIRYDDQCKNGHNTFSITGTLYQDYRWVVGGCIHDLVAEYFPELAHAIPFHLCSSDGPIHYIANTLYWVREKNFPYARNSAVWPDATDDDLNNPNLEQMLLERLPDLIVRFREVVEGLGLKWE